MNNYSKLTKLWGISCQNHSNCRFLYSIPYNNFQWYTIFGGIVCLYSFVSALDISKLLVQFLHTDKKERKEKFKRKHVRQQDRFPTILVLFVQIAILPRYRMILSDSQNAVNIQKLILQLQLQLSPRILQYIVIKKALCFTQFQQPF